MKIAATVLFSSIIGLAMPAMAQVTVPYGGNGPPATIQTGPNGFERNTYKRVAKKSLWGATKQIGKRVAIGAAAAGAAALGGTTAAAAGTVITVAGGLWLVYEVTTGE